MKIILVINSFFLFSFLFLTLFSSFIGGNVEVFSFYISYYRYCEPSCILQELKTIWSDHSSFFWPTPYTNIHPNVRYVNLYPRTHFTYRAWIKHRLYYFLKGFIESPFVLTDNQKDMQFRCDLACLYEELVCSSTNWTPVDLKTILQVRK